MVGDGGLDLLISTESRLAEQLAAAQAEALAIREAARAAVAADESGYEAELAAATKVLAARHAEQRQAEIARLQVAADSAVRRFEVLASERGEALAASVARRVLAAWSAEAPP